MDWLIFGSINIIAMVAMFLFLSRRLHRRFNAKSFLAEIEQEVNAIITELNQTTERNLQLVENRIERLNALNALLDKRITMAQTELEKRQEGSATYQHLQNQRRQIQREMARDQAQPRPAVPELFPAAEAPEPASDRPPVAGAAPAAPARAPAAFAPQPPEPAAAPQPYEPAAAAPAPAAQTPVADAAAGGMQVVRVQKAISRDLMRAQVADMARAGIAPALIAQHFGMSLGEIELMISLQAERE